MFEAAVVFMESVLQQVCAVHLRSGRSGDKLPPSAASIVAAGEALLQQVPASPCWRRPPRGTDTNLCTTRPWLNHGLLRPMRPSTQPV